MGLYVRYGEDNDLQNGRVVSDYASREPTGNEEIVITPQSDPPLRAGTYFVSVALYDTGVVAMGTLTVTVERDDTPLPPIGGGPLTPGQPAVFRLGPVDSPTIFIEDKSFRLEVPTGATRVIFTLESVDPDVDVDLFVRFGEDNTIAGWEGCRGLLLRGNHGQRTDRHHPALRPAASSRNLLRLGTRL